MATSKWVYFALGITVVYGLGLWSLERVTVAGITSLELNALGDFLAGVFAPLAFLWLTTAVVLQSQELKAQREELALTRSEIEMTRAVLTEQAKEARTQAEFIGQQIKIMSRRANDRTLAVKISGIVTHAAVHLRDDLYFETDAGNRQKVPPPISHKTPVEAVTFKMVSDGCISLQRTIENLWRAQPDRKLLGFAANYAEMDRRLDEVRHLLPEISEKRRAYLEEMKFDELAQAVKNITTSIQGPI